MLDMKVCAPAREDAIQESHKPRSAAPRSVSIDPAIPVRKLLDIVSYTLTLLQRVACRRDQPRRADADAVEARLRPGIFHP